MIVLQGGRARLAVAVDDIVAGHRQLIGPRHLGEPIGGVAAVVRASHTDRQSTLTVRTTGAVRDPLWTVREPSLEEIILAYLAERDTAASHEAWGVSA